MKSAAALSILLLIVGGCIPKQRAHTGPTPYIGPTETMSEVVQAVNANSGRIETLSARGYFEANVADPNRDGRTFFVNGDITMLYRKPDELRLVAKKDVAGTVFDVGSNAERYWLIVKGDVDTMWYGAHDGLGATASNEIPIRPDLMLDVLGVGTFGQNFREPPIPVMRFNNDADAYSFVWNAPLPDRWAAQKEVWYDRKTKLPTKVILFDMNGRVVLRANLAKHVPIGEEPNAPKIASDYRLYFPDTGTTMSFELNDLAATRGGAPNARSFSFPGDRAGVSKMRDVDQPRDPAAPSSSSPDAMNRDPQRDASPR